jgi:hypothetical protein
MCARADWARENNTYHTSEYENVSALCSCSPNSECHLASVCCVQTCLCLKLALAREARAKRGSRMVWRGGCECAECELWLTTTTCFLRAACRSGTRPSPHFSTMCFLSLPSWPASAGSACSTCDWPHSDANTLIRTEIRVLLAGSGSPTHSHDTFPFKSQLFVHSRKYIFNFSSEPSFHVIHIKNSGET